MRYVLFVCNHNAGRSQMAQAFFERHAPADVRAESAGSAPSRQVWPTVVEAMAEVGLDLSTRKPRKLLREMQLQVRTHAQILALRRTRDCLRRESCGELVSG